MLAELKLMYSGYFSVHIHTYVYHTYVYHKFFSSLSASKIQILIIWIFCDLVRSARFSITFRRQRCQRVDFAVLSIVTPVSLLLKIRETPIFLLTRSTNE
jgi:hypothetical protein